MRERPDRDGVAGRGPLPPLIAFGRDLRARGLIVGTGRILTFVRAVAALGLADRDSLYWAGRTTMVGRRDDLEKFDEAFEEWYRSLRPIDDLGVALNLPTAEPGSDEAVFGPEPDDLEVQVGQAAAEWHGADEDEEEPGEESSIRIVASGAEVLRTKSFGDLTDEERERIAALIRSLRLRHHHRSPPVLLGAGAGAARNG